MGLIIPYVGLSHSRYINSMEKSETTIVTDVTDETDTTDTTVTFVQHRPRTKVPNRWSVQTRPPSSAARPAERGGHR